MFQKEIHLDLPFFSVQVKGNERSPIQTSKKMPREMEEFQPCRVFFLKSCCDSPPQSVQVGKCWDFMTLESIHLGSQNLDTSRNCQMCSDENPVDIPLYWLVNRDPYNGLL